MVKPGWVLFFSQARSLIGLQRRSLTPLMLEAILFLKVNRAYWNAEVVHQSIERAENFE
jgi:hypothetical protein